MSEEIRERKADRYVSWKVYVWTVTAAMAAISYLAATDLRLQARIDAQSTQYVTIQTQLSQIQTDLVWLKQTLATHSNK